MEPDEKICELMSLWNAGPATSSGSNSNSGPSDAKESLHDVACAFIFKKKIFLRDDSREMADPVAKHGVYIQVCCYRCSLCLV